MAAAIWLISAKSWERFVSKTDPITGYRCSFTLAHNWQRRQEYEPWNRPFDSSTKLLESIEYVPVPPTSFRTWIETHLLHRATPRSNKENQIDIYVVQSDTLSSTKLHDGYLESKWLDLPDLMYSGRIKIIENQHYLLGGQPATKIKLSFEHWYYDGGHSVSMFYQMVIKVRDKPFIVVLEGEWDEAHDGAMQAEMEAIRESFRLEKPGGHE